MNDAQTLAAEVRVGAEAVGVCIVGAPLDLQNSGCPTVHLSVEELLELVAAVRPAIIYLFESLLNPETELEAALEALDAEPTEDVMADLLRATNRINGYEGISARTTVEFVAQGVHHLAYAEAYWITKFDNEVEAISERASETAEESRREENRAAAAHVRALAQRLLADPAFDNGRPSLAKRRFLAAELFPDEVGRTLDAVTETAENLRWLALGRT